MKACYRAWASLNSFCQAARLLTPVSGSLNTSIQHPTISFSDTLLFPCNYSVRSFILGILSLHILATSHDLSISLPNLLNLTSMSPYKADSSTLFLLLQTLPSLRPKVLIYQKAQASAIPR